MAILVPGTRSILTQYLVYLVRTILRSMVYIIQNRSVYSAENRKRIYGYFFCPRIQRIIVIYMFQSGIRIECPRLWLPPSQWSVSLLRTLKQEISRFPFLKAPAHTSLLPLGTPRQCYTVLSPCWRIFSLYVSNWNMYMVESVGLGFALVGVVFT